jgi:hypothetical protein
MAKAPSLIERLGRVWQLSDYVVACRFERSGALAFALGDGSLTIVPHADGEPLTVQAHAGRLTVAKAPWAKRLSPWAMPNPGGSRPLLRHLITHWWLPVMTTGSC